MLPVQQALFDGGICLCNAGVQLEEPFSVLPLDKLARECQDDITEMITSMQGTVITGFEG